MLYGTDAVTATRLKLAVDEDSKLDAERAHTTESMSYLVFQDTALQLDGAAAPQRARAELTLDAVQQLVQRAIALWDADDEIVTGCWTGYRCRSATCRVSSWHKPRRMDLALDVNAAGWGWFVDGTPEDDEEFLRGLDGDLFALDGGPAAGQVDLLTVLAHELGHVRGLGHDHQDPQAVMSPTLPLGVRRLPQSSARVPVNRRASSQSEVGCVKLAANAWRNPPTSRRAGTPRPHGGW